MQNLWLRILILSLLILIVNTWSLHHIGKDVVNVFMANGPLVLIAIFNFLWGILKKDKNTTEVSKIYSWLTLFLKTPVLVLLFGIILLAGSIVSSVTVMDSGTQGNLTLSLVPEGQSQTEKNRTQLSGPNEVRKFIKFTSPFGRAFYLEVDGYLRHSFDLYPWFGKKIRITRDLSISPSILIRVPVSEQMGLSNGRIEVWEGQSKIAEEKTDKNHAAIIVGHNIAIPNAFFEKWNMEFTAYQVPKEAAALSLLRWQQPKVIRSEVPLSAGKKIVAKFFVNEVIRAKAAYEVKSKKIQDVLLIVEGENQ
jgi:hypothetical protein